MVDFRLLDCIIQTDLQIVSMSFMETFHCYIIVVHLHLIIKIAPKFIITKFLLAGDIINENQVNNII